MSKHRPNKQPNCPCGSRASYDTCCGPFIEGRQQPDTAEQLMRSRYTAYTLGNGEWLRQTWHPATRRLDAGMDPAIKWLRLKIVATESGGPNDDKGVVEFIAHYKVNGRAQRLHERSRFQRRAGHWYYVDGAPEPETTAENA